MSNEFKLNAKVREDMGKGASRRLRRLEKLVPAIIYGGQKEPQNISVSHNELFHALEHEAFYSHIIELNVDGKNEDVILKDLQRHPAKPIIMHADFLRVSKTQKLHTKVPLHFINEDSCIGVKKSGGKINHSMTELDITCLPTDLPEFITVDMASVDVGSTLHISDLALPKGVESVDLSHGEDHDLPVVAVNKPKGGAEATENDAETPASEETAKE